MFNYLLLALVSAVPAPRDVPDVCADVAVLTVIEYPDSRIERKLVLKDWIDAEETHVIRCSRYVSSPDDPQNGNYFVHRQFKYNAELKRYEMYYNDPINENKLVRILVRSLEEDVTDCDPDPPYYGYEGEGWFNPCTGQWIDYDPNDRPYYKYLQDKFFTAINAQKRRLEAKTKKK